MGDKNKKTKGGFKPLLPTAEPDGTRVNQYNPNLDVSTNPDPTFLENLTNPIRKNLAENLYPESYAEPFKRVWDAARGKKSFMYDARYPDGLKQLYSETDRVKERTDLLHMTMGQDQKYNTVKKSKYKPTKAKDSNVQYYTSPQTEAQLRKYMAREDFDWSNRTGHGSPTLGEFTYDSGEDEEGKYVSYYDIWDLNPLDHLYSNKRINNLVDKVTNAVGITPPEIYGRVYFKDVPNSKFKEGGKPGIPVGKKTENFFIPPITSVSDNLGENSNYNVNAEISAAADERSTAIENALQLYNKGEIDETSFKEEFGTSIHAYKMSTDAEYYNRFKNRGDIGGGTVMSQAQRQSGSNPNLQWITGASNQTNASSEQKQQTQDFHNDIIGAVTPIPLLDGLKLTSKGAKIPGLIDDGILKPIKAKELNLSTKKAPTPTSAGNINTYKPREIQDVIQKRKTYLLSDEYITKRAANTGESRNQIKAHIDTYLKELDNTTLGMYKDGDLGKNIYGNYSAEGVKINKDRSYEDILNTIDHEVNHLLSPVNRTTRNANPHTNVLWKDLETGKRLTNNEAQIHTKDLDFDINPEWQAWEDDYAKLYKDYPAIKMDVPGDEKFAKYLNLPEEQQVRMVRYGEILKKHGWDGTEKGLTNDIINKTAGQMQGKISLGTPSSSGSTLPSDVGQLLGQMEGIKVGSPEWYDQIKKTLPYAWGMAPVAIGSTLEGSTYQDGGDVNTPKWDWGNYKRNNNFLDTDMSSVNWDVLYNSINRHEHNAGYPEYGYNRKDSYDNWIRNKQTGSGSSAFGPSQITRGLLADLLKDGQQKYYNEANIDRDFVEQLLDQSDLFLKYGGSDMKEGFEDYDYGGVGDVEDTKENREKYKKLSIELMKGKYRQGVDKNPAGFSVTDLAALWKGAGDTKGYSEEVTGHYNNLYTKDLMEKEIEASKTKEQKIPEALYYNQPPADDGIPSFIKEEEVYADGGNVNNNSASEHLSGWVSERKPFIPTGVTAGSDPEMYFEDSFNTELSEDSKEEYDIWLDLWRDPNTGNPINRKDIGAYDIQGYFLSGDWEDTDEDGHGSDRWKKPNHPTFSEHSIWSAQKEGSEYEGGTWMDNSSFLPGFHNMHDNDRLEWEFNREPHRPEHLFKGGYILPEITITAEDDE